MVLNPFLLMIIVCESKFADALGNLKTLNLISFGIMKLVANDYLSLSSLSTMACLVEINLKFEF